MSASFRAGFKPFDDGGIEITKWRAYNECYPAEKAFAPCVNIYAGHDLYYEVSCPVPSPRLCIEPIPQGVNFHVTNKKREPRTEETFVSPDDSTIPFANMTMITRRIIDQPKEWFIPMDCLKCWNYTDQRIMWSTYVKSIEKTVGFQFLNGPVRTVLEFGCGSGGFLGEMAVRGVTGICTAREVPNAKGSETYLPYLRTVAARGLIAMHVSITTHQPFLSNSFDFIHCSWVLAYVSPTPRMYSQIFIEWDRLLTPGGLIVQRGAWCKRKANPAMLKLFSYSRYLLETVLQWTILDWTIVEEASIGSRSTLSFIAKKPLQRISKDWSKDPFLLKSCTPCFKESSVVGK
eukprot:gene29413-38507_t